LALVIVAVNVTFRANRWFTMIAGLLSGTLLTSTGLNGPPLVVLIRAANYSVRQYRATLAAIFFVHGWAGIALLAGAGKINTGILSLAAVGVLIIPIGFVVGERLFKHIDARRLRLGITLMLTLCI